jgi:hypothetical protein
MDRRKFIKGAVATAVAAAIPVGDGVELYSIAHPEYTYKTYKTDVLYKATPVPRDLGCQMARALARSMMQTKEQVTANVLNRAFGDEHV